MIPKKTPKIKSPISLLDRGLDDGSQLEVALPTIVREIDSICKSKGLTFSKFKMIFPSSGTHYEISNSRNEILLEATFFKPEKDERYSSAWVRLGHLLGEVMALEVE